MTRSASGLFAAAMTAAAMVGCGSGSGDEREAATSIGSGGAAGAGGAGESDARAGGGAASFSDDGSETAADGGVPTDGSVPHDARPDSPQSGDAGSCAPGTGRFVTGTLDHAFGPGQTTGQADFPAAILGPPRGAGCCQGSFDVVSLGNGGFVVVEFEGNAIVDGPGADFIVFENAFWAGGDESAPFAELATVSVSEDGVEWHDYVCTAVEAPYGSCAGWRPVFANADDNDVDPLDPDVAGGDPFDLADVGLTRARFVRIEDRVDLDGLDGAFDLDAVGIVNAECP